jgi:SAM-dependent methyltransferase
MNNASQQHWEHVYETKAEHEVSWFQANPQHAGELMTLFNLPPNAAIIDIGGGDSHFVDAMLAAGYTNITVLDISAAAIYRAIARLGEKAGKVTWVVSDITSFKSTKKYDLWHDRAAFHFLTSEEQINQYVAIAGQVVKNAGYLLLGTFSENGPTKCSGLEIKQYSEPTMTARFAADFEKLKCLYEDHVTPANKVQHFIFCGFRRK